MSIFGPKPYTGHLKSVEEEDAAKNKDVDDDLKLAVEPVENSDA